MARTIYFSFWPTGRGIFHNQGANIQAILSRLIKGLEAISAKLGFSIDARLGFTTFCPTNLGTTIRASCRIKVPKLAVEEGELQKIADANKLQIRGIHGEHSKTKNGIFDISSKQR